MQPQLKEGANDGSSVDSGCKPVEEQPEKNEELSDGLDFQSNANLIKKKREPNRKRQRSDLVAKLDEVVLETEALKTDCLSPSNLSPCNNEKVAEGGDEHLPLSKRARVCLEKSLIELGSGLAGNLSTGVSRSNISGSCLGLNMEVLEKHGKTVEVVLDCCKTSGVGSSYPELCRDSSDHAECVPANA